MCPVARSLAKRLAILIGTLLLVTVLAFLAFSVIPADPTLSILGAEATDEQIAVLRAQLGLDLPVYVRYWNWLSAFVTGDFGRSYHYNMTVAELLGPRIGVTLTLALMAFVLILIIAVPLGLLCAWKQGGWLDRALTVLNQINMAIPNFVLGIVLVYLFGLLLHLFQPNGFVYPSESVGRYLWFMFFPALSVALPKAAMTVKMLRGSILSEGREDYIRTAYSKGNSTGSVLRRHVLRNAMIPTVTFIALTVADIVAGSIVVEQVFAVPGMGLMLISSIGSRDYPVVQAIVVIIAAAVVLCNFLADILYRVMDPRLRGR